MTTMATPVAYLLTQAHLLEIDGKPIQARDVLGVARRLVRTLEDNAVLPTVIYGSGVWMGKRLRQGMPDATSSSQSWRLLLLISTSGTKKSR